MSEKKKYRFARLVNGVRMAEGVVINDADNQQEAEMLGYKLLKDQDGAASLWKTELKLLEIF